jgi:hypothetical protein
VQFVDFRKEMLTWPTGTQPQTMGEISAPAGDFWKTPTGYGPSGNGVFDYHPTTA